MDRDDKKINIFKKRARERERERGERATVGIRFYCKLKLRNSQ